MSKAQNHINLIVTLCIEFNIVGIDKVTNNIIYGGEYAKDIAEAKQWLHMILSGIDFLHDFIGGTKRARSVLKYAMAMSILEAQDYGSDIAKQKILAGIHKMVRGSTNAMEQRTYNAFLKSTYCDKCSLVPTTNLKKQGFFQVTRNTEYVRDRGSSSCSIVGGDSMIRVPGSWLDNNDCTAYTINAYGRAGNLTQLSKKDGDTLSIDTIHLGSEPPAAGRPAKANIKLERGTGEIEWKEGTSDGCRPEVEPYSKAIESLLNGSPDNLYNCFIKIITGNTMGDAMVFGDVKRNGDTSQRGNENTVFITHDRLAAVKALIQGYDVVLTYSTPEGQFATLISIKGDVDRKETCNLLQEGTQRTFDYGSFIRARFDTEEQALDQFFRDLDNIVQTLESKKYTRIFRFKYPNEHVRLVRQQLDKLTLFYTKIQHTDTLAESIKEGYVSTMDGHETHLTKIEERLETLREYAANPTARPPPPQQRRQMKKKKPAAPDKKAVQQYIDENPQQLTERGLRASRRDAIRDALKKGGAYNIRDQILEHLSELEKIKTGHELLDMYILLLIVSIRRRISRIHEFFVNIILIELTILQTILSEKEYSKHLLANSIEVILYYILGPEDDYFIYFNEQISRLQGVLTMEDITNHNEESIEYPLIKHTLITQYTQHYKSLTFMVTPALPTFYQRILIQHQIYVTMKIREEAPDLKVGGTIGLKSANPPQAARAHSAVPAVRVLGNQAASARSVMATMATKAPPPATAIFMEGSKQLGFQAPRRGVMAKTPATAIFKKGSQHIKVSTFAEENVRDDGFLKLSFKDKKEYLSTLPLQERNSLLRVLFNSYFNEDSFKDVDVELLSVEFEICSKRNPTSKPKDSSTREKAFVIFQTYVDIFPEYLDIMTLSMLNYRTNRTPLYPNNIVNIVNISSVKEPAVRRATVGGKNKQKTKDVTEPSWEK